MGNESKSFRAAALEHGQMPMVSWKNLMDGLLQFNSTAFYRRYPWGCSGAVGNVR